MHRRLSAALEYAGRGWPVLPLNGKLPATAHGVLDATTDPTTIRRRWSQQNYNIGIATGRASGLCVVDIDPGGEDTLADLEDRYGSLPDTVEAHTGRGRHLYFKVPQGVSVANGVHCLGHGLDVRGDGGYVVAPGSYHKETGRDYCWEVDHDPEDVELALAPRWILDLLSNKDINGNRTQPGSEIIVQDLEPTSYGLAALEAECTVVAAAKIGTQEDTLNKAAFNLGQLIESGDLPNEMARDRLIEAGLQMENDPAKQPWTKEQIAKKIARALVHGAGHPREERSPEAEANAVAGAVDKPDQVEEDYFDMSSLKDHEPGPVEWIIEPLIPIGFSLLAGRPKLGKSYLILDAAANTANGDQVAAAFPTERTGVLFIAFEDDKDRIRRRLDDIGMEPENFPANCRVHVNWPSGKAGIAKLDDFLTKYPDKRVVFIDTLQHILDPKLEEGYRLTTAELRPLRDLSRKHRVAIVGVLHTRKGKAIKDEDYDPLDFDNIIGSRAYSAVADAIIMMYRVQGEKHGRLAVTGRDMADTIFNATFENRRWTFKTVNRKQTIRKQVLEMFEQHSEAIYSPLDLCHRLGLNPAEHHDAMRQRLRRMVKEGVIEQAGYGMYRRQKSEE
jgi:RecA-family ATPase